MQEINTEIYVKKKKIKRDNMEEIGIIICLKKSKKNSFVHKKKDIYCFNISIARKRYYSER